MPGNMLPNFQPSRFISGSGVSISFDSALSVADDATVSTVIAQASVNGQDGPHTFTLTDDASGQFAITTGGELSVAAALTAGLQSISISADNGVDDPVAANRSVLVTVSPANSVAPVVSGTPEVGATLTTTDGTWTGEPAPTFTYQWQRDGVNISGATASTYVLVDADDGTDVECDVTADNGINTATAASNALSITYPTPAFTTAATISAQNVVGQTLTATPGVVDPPSGSGSTITYQWTRDAVNIAAATASTYTLVSADENTDVTCVVTATTNNPGTATATSTPTAVTVLYIAPTQNGSLTNQSFTENTGDQTYDTSGGFTGNGLSYSLVSPPTGVTISSITGIVTHDSDSLAIQTGTTITVRATNNGGSVDQTYDLAITASAGVDPEAGLTLSTTIAVGTREASNTSMDRSNPSVFAIDFTGLDGSSGGLIWEGGGTGTGAYIGFRTNGDFVWRVGDGSSASFGSACAYILASSGQPSGDGTLVAEVDQSGMTVRAWWDGIEIGTPVSAPAAVNWYGTFLTNYLNEPQVGGGDDWPTGEEETVVSYTTASAMRVYDNQTSSA